MVPTQLGFPKVSYTETTNLDQNPKPDEKRKHAPSSKPHWIYEWPM